MKETEKENEYIKSLALLNLTYEESLVYLYLVKKGASYTGVKDLNKNLNIKRTTIYSILHRLIEKKCIREEKYESSFQGYKIRRYCAISPEIIYSSVFEHQKQILQYLKEIKSKEIKQLEDLYKNGNIITIENIDSFLKPYFQPLVEKGWKINSIKIAKTAFILECVIYDCTLYCPYAKILNDAGFIAIKFDSIIEDDQTTIDFIMSQVAKRGREEILEKGIHNVQLIPSEMKLFNKNWFSYRFKFQYSPNTEYQEFSSSVIFPIKNLIFCLWAESKSILEEMANGFFK